LVTTEGFRQWFGRRDRPQVVAVGNQKGGSGKTTTAIHLLVGLLRRGMTVGSIDLDVRQGTLSRFVRNRERFAAATGITPPMPEHRGVARSVHATVAEANDDEATRLAAAFDDLIGRDWVVVDIPGDNSFLARTGHLLADVLVTPLNDSFLDLDALVRIDVDGQRIIGPSAYSVMVTDGRARQAALGGRPCDWVVMRNRLAHLESRNRRQIGALLETLAPRLGFRLARGFGERVIFRQLFTSGLTVLDLDEPAIGVAMSASHMAAQEEVEALLETVCRIAAGQPALAAPA
jgi:chromosome partitioning protein